MAEANDKTEVAEAAAAVDTSQDEEVTTYLLKVSHGGCTGVNWRGNPFTKARPTGDTSNWPRNGSHLRGVQRDCGGTPWLEVYEIKQAGTDDWVSVKGEGKWMGYDGGAFNGGKWLHDPEE